MGYPKFEKGTSTIFFIKKNIEKTTFNAYFPTPINNNFFVVIFHDEKKKHPKNSCQLFFICALHFFIKFFFFYNFTTSSTIFWWMKMGIWWRLQWCRLVSVREFEWMWTSSNDAWQQTGIWYDVPWQSKRNIFVASINCKFKNGQFNFGF